MAEDWFPKMRLNQIGIFLLLILGAAQALAEPGLHKQETRNVVRTYQFFSVEKSEHAGQEAQPVEPRRPREFAFPDNSEYAMQGENQLGSVTRRQGRMTLEERRALRRQIDEVGHDIYAPKP